MAFIQSILHSIGQSLDSVCKLNSLTLTMTYPSLN